MKRPLIILVVVGTAFAGAMGARAGVDTRITIRHEQHGCHTWSVAGGAWRATQSVTIHAGATIEFMNDDLMTHRLTQLAGPRLTMPPTMLQSTFKHPGGGTVELRFARRGVYRLRTVDGDESGKPTGTVGADNVLRLTVRVV